MNSPDAIAETIPAGGPPSPAGGRPLPPAGYKLSLDLRGSITDVRGKNFGVLDLSEPTAGAWQLTDDLTDRAFDMKALSIFSTRVESDIRKLGVRDFRGALKRIGEFFPFDDEAPIGEAETTLTVELRAPVKDGDKSIDLLALNEPTAGAWEKWSGISGTAADIRAVATVAQISERSVRQMLVGDVKLAAIWIGRFFVDAPATGAQS